MMCTTIKKYGVKKDGSKGNPIIGNKIRYETLEEAQAEAERQNAHPKVFIKREAYKCKKCKKYHVGKTYDMIEGKVAKPKVDKFRSLNLKVVGKIDLSQFETKPRVKESKIGKQVHMASLKEICPDILKSHKTLRKELRLNVKNGIVGGIKIEGELWKYYTKDKTVKIITPNGRIRFIKQDKLSDMVQLQRHKIIKYIINNHIELETGR